MQMGHITPPIPDKLTQFRRMKNKSLLPKETNLPSGVAPSRMLATRPRPVSLHYRLALASCPAVARRPAGYSRLWRIACRPWCPRGGTRHPRSSVARDAFGWEAPKGVNKARCHANLPTQPNLKVITCIIFFLKEL